MADPFKLNPSLAAKIGSILVHVEEGLSRDEHPFDWTAARTMMAMSDVREWLDELGKMALIPKKRRS